MNIWAITLCGLFIFVHLFSSSWHLEGAIPRSRVLSAAGGISVAYVFLHLLPELQEHQGAFAERLSWGRHHVYFMSLAGLVVFYGLERLVKISSRCNPARNPGPRDLAFWIHAGAFSVYNVIIGYLTVRNAWDSHGELVIFGVTLALHFQTTDYGIREHYRRDYLCIGRWLFSFGISAGWLIGLFVHVDTIVLAALFAFLSGGIILNVMKDELPEERKSSYPAFLGGALFHSLLLYLLI